MGPLGPGPNEWAQQGPNEWAQQGPNESPSSQPASSASQPAQPASSARQPASKPASQQASQPIVYNYLLGDFGPKWGQNWSLIGRGWSQTPPRHFWGTFGSKYFVQTNVKQRRKHMKRPDVWKPFFVVEKI